MKSGEILTLLAREAEQDKVSASYLFYGDRRVDLLHYALEFSSMVMVKDVEDEKTIQKIQRSIRSFQHPDVEVINRKNEGIKIDEVREIIYGAIESAYSSSKKIFIISGLENLRKEAGNALLKILEEPPRNVYFILLSRSLNIIPTIKSRTIKFHLESAGREELGVSREVYYLFDGNESDIRRYKERGVSIEEYEDTIASMDDAMESLRIMSGNIHKREEIQPDTYEEDAHDLDAIIRYNKSIEYMVKKIRFLSMEEVFILINKIEAEFKQDKEFIILLLGRIISASKAYIDGENLKRLIELKNSIRNNVNLKSVLFNFFIAII